MSNTKFSDEFKKLKPNYEKLGSNVQQSLEIFLNEQDIPYLSIKNRVKELQSYLEKIERKGYEKPINEIEDICGIRIICYFQNDIEKIKDIILKEFDVTENQSKQELLNATEFGYRSTHFIATIKDSWTSTPNYRGLNDLKFEIQVRTILMHSWAEIEHKLAYKSEVDIPKELRRKFSFISAVLEDADIKFEEIKNAIAKNKSQLIKEAKRKQQFDENLELNLDNLQAFLDYAFEDRKSDIKETRSVLKEMLKYNISFKNLILNYFQYKDILKQIENETIKEIDNHDEDLLWHQAGAVRKLMELISDDFFNDRKTYPLAHIVKKYRSKNI
ncbi:GTP pyrophosphokinase [Acinetobacter albensis]|uniref:RelA/SpoT domain-containing protein n=1 Tax=Acinetobacter albensis TaxID=1673609 RepID=A0A1C4GVG2_9GAMM|nr:hypothetical protein [Acinetobacter albensis]SCC71813.1 hypothetical protein GA0116959_10633 [Acinetobacter albensis]